MNTRAAGHATLIVEVARRAGVGIRQGTPMTVGLPHGRSDYEPEPETRWTTWGTVSSGFREIEIGWDRLESVGLLAPADPACFDI
jgi:hypothetical protein